MKLFHIFAPTHRANKKKNKAALFLESKGTHNAIMTNSTGRNADLEKKALKLSLAKKVPTKRGTSVKVETYHQFSLAYMYSEAIRQHEP